MDVCVGDHFNDGWDSARLRVEHPDGTYEEYSPHYDTVYPYSVRFCPALATSGGIYSFRIRKFSWTLFYWEISYQVPC